jgi:hypothetical protein
MELEGAREVALIEEAVRKRDLGERSVGANDISR